MCVSFRIHGFSFRICAWPYTCIRQISLWKPRCPWFHGPSYEIHGVAGYDLTVHGGAASPLERPASDSEDPSRGAVCGDRGSLDNGKWGKIIQIWWQNVANTQRCIIHINRKCVFYLGVSFGETCGIFCESLLFVSWVLVLDSLILLSWTLNLGLARTEGRLLTLRSTRCVFPSGGRNYSDFLILWNAYC